jgi:hypothetical protein
MQLNVASIPITYGNKPVMCCVTALTSMTYCGPMLMAVTNRSYGNAQAFPIMPQISFHIQSTQYPPCQLSPPIHRGRSSEKHSFPLQYISKIYFSHWKSPGVSESMWSVNSDASISGEYLTLGWHSGRPWECLISLMTGTVVPYV